tara:strand:- start:3020 stop:3733 length:714 start_codon:yes stop_codon:yes gene_type:complete
MTKSLKRIATKKEFFILIVSGILMTLHFMLFYKSIQVSSLAVGIISLYTFPCFSALVEPLFYKQSYRKRHIFLTLGTLGGIALLSFHQIEGASIMLGLLYGILSALFFTFRNIFLKPLTTTYPSMLLMALQCLVGASLFTPFFVNPLLSINYETLLLLILSGVIFTALAHSLFIKSIQFLSVTTVSIVASFQILYAVVLGVFFLNESLSVWVVSGGLVVLIVVVVEQILCVQEVNEV